MFTSLDPDFPPELLPLIRVAFGGVIAATVVSLWRHRRRMFCRTDCGGYLYEPSWGRLETPRGADLVWGAWLAAACGLTLGWGTVPCAIVNLLFARHYFVALRWCGVQRGCGAPGFVTYWFSAAACLLELGAAFAPDKLPLALWVLQLDLGLIMLSSGVYKLFAGYALNEGMEYGLVNPAWGHWHRMYARLSPQNPLFWFYNQMTWIAQIVIAVALLIPAARFWAAIGLGLSFLFVMSQVRLGTLCPMIILTALLFVDRSSPGIEAVVGIAQSLPVSHNMGGIPGPAIGFVLGISLVGYACLTPLAHLGLSVNFYFRKHLPGPAQRWLEAYTNFFGIIVWRVFSVNVTNFFIDISGVPDEAAAGNAETTYSFYDRWGNRFHSVLESITVTCVFTTLKYYETQPELFQQRLLTLARTLARAPGHSRIRFRAFSILKDGTRFQYKLTAVYTIDPQTGELTIAADDPRAFARGHHASRIHETATPGTYAPRKPVPCAE